MKNLENFVKREDEKLVNLLHKCVRECKRRSIEINMSIYPNGEIFYRDRKRIMDNRHERKQTRENKAAHDISVFGV